MKPGVTTLQLSSDEALVFLDWISRLNRRDDLRFEDQAEQRVLWDIEAQLEKSVPSIVSPDYLERLAEARSKVRD